MFNIFFHINANSYLIVSLGNLSFANTQIKTKLKLEDFCNSSLDLECCTIYWQSNQWYFNLFFIFRCNSLFSKFLAYHTFFNFYVIFFSIFINNFGYWYAIVLLSIYNKTIKSESSLENSITIKFRLKFCYFVKINVLILLFFFFGGGGVQSRGDSKADRMWEVKAVSRTATIHL